MRERTPLPRTVIERLPRLKMIASTGPFNASIDVAAAEEHGIYVSTTGGYVESTVELTWALILTAARRIVDEKPFSTRRWMADARWAGNWAKRRWVCWAWAGSAPGWRGSERRSAWT